MSFYAELHCKTNFSFLRGASHPGELVTRAAELGYAALAVTDRNSLAGIVRAHGVAKQVGLKLLIGAEITPVDAPAVVLLATDRDSYGRLSRLITCGRRKAPKGECRITFDDIACHAQGLLAAVVAEPHPSDEASFPSRHLAISRDGQEGPSDIDALRRYRDLFGSRCSLLAELHYGPNDSKALERSIAISHKTDLPLVAAGDVHYHQAERRPLHDVLTATRLGTTVHAMSRSRFANAERHLRSVEQLEAIFANAPHAIDRAREIAERCTFSLDELRYEYPEELVPFGMTPIDHLTDVTWRGAQRRYPQGIPDEACRQIQHELNLIRELHYASYFLTVWDLVQFARRRDILCQGRGSAANSIVCYCLEITSIDPARMDLLFERFVSRERNEAPDIDVDFEHERREEVLQYLYDKYGRERVGMTAEVITYRRRSAVRDVGKALGLEADEVDRLARSLEGRGEESIEKRFADAGFDVDSQKAKQLVGLTEQLCGFPRHLSQHVGGMVMTHGPLCELVPIENAAMADRTVIQWNKDDLDELGILKVDCLSLGMLTAIRKCFALVQQQTGQQWTLANIPPDDTEVYDMICRADTVGVFQIESRGQMSMLPRLQPRCFYDLVIEIAIVRPGPIQGNMVHPYLRRRMGLEEATYPNDAIRQILEKTLGVPLFQEQAMRMAMVAAGFTAGEADALRRAMSAWRRPGLIEQFHERLIAGMRAQGLSDAFAETVFRQIRGFGEYGFPESHAASFALLVYASAWLKCHYPAAFTTALLNSQPMGFYAPAQLVRDARDHHVEVLPVDVHASDWDCTLEGQGERPAVRMGFRRIAGLSRVTADRIVAARSSEGPTPCIEPFDSIDDFAQRTGVGRAVVALLSHADAFRSLGLDRRRALWNALACDTSARPMPLFDQEPCEDDLCDALPVLSDEAQVHADYRSTGLSLRAHPISFYRDALTALDAVPCRHLARLPAGRLVRIAGLVLVRQRPSTAKGITFVTLEDETGTANLIVRKDVWERFFETARNAPAWVVRGRLERKQNVMHVVVHKLDDLSGRLGTLRTATRDFH